MKTTTLIKTLLLAACCWTGAATAGPLPVVASFSILGDVAQQVGGERVLVQSIVGPDQDSHVYQANPADIRKIRAAKLVLMNGIGLEGAALQRAMRDAKVPVAVVTKGIEPARMADDDHARHDHGSITDHGHTSADPHVWHDPALMQHYAQNVADALTQADPEGKAYYGQRLADYQKTLKELDAWAAQQFATVPVAGRKVLTGHDAFGYLGRRYQVQFFAPQGLSTESEASARTVAQLIAQVRKENIKAVFIENIRDPRLINQLGKEAGVKLQTVPLYSDALSGPQGPVRTYVNLMRHNVTHIVRALKGG